MKIDLLTRITNLDGTPIPEAGEKTMTLRSVFCNVLTTQKPNDTIAGIEKVRRYNLATQIFANPIIDLGVDDIKLLRDLVAEIYIPLVVGQVWNILDPPPAPEPETKPEDAPEEATDGVDIPEGTI